MHASISQSTYRLSPAQKVFEASRFEADKGLNVEQVVCTSSEALNLPAFRQAWQTIIDRHSALRMGIKHDDQEEPRQEIHSPVDAPVFIEDRRDLKASERDAFIEERLEQDRRANFKLSVPPLMRVTVIRFADNLVTWVWTFHHILLDGRSFLLVLEDFFACYEAHCTGAAPLLPERKHFAEFIAWHESWMASHQASAKSFWRQLYRENETESDLGISRTSSPANHRHGKIRLKPEPELTERLHGLADKFGLTINTVVQGTWALLLSRYYRSKAVTFATVRSCRRGSIDGTDGMIGMLMNSLPVHARICEAISIVDFLKEIKEQQLAARAYQWTLWEDIRNSIPIAASKQFSDSCVLYERYNIPQEMTRRFGMNGTRTFSLRERANIPLLLSVSERPQVQFELIYLSAMFQGEDMEQLGQSFLSLLYRVLERPDASIGTLELAKFGPTLSDAQRARRERYNATSVPRVSGLIHAGFFTEAQKHPSRIAVDDPRRRVGYGELAGRAYSVARRLRNAGVREGDLVAVVMEKGWEQIASVLGILRAGGAYLPIDPELPKARLEYLMSNGRVSIALTQPRLRDALAWPLRIKVWTLEEQNDNTDPYDGPEPGPDSLAYVIYTSGSTGDPKGVMIAHSAALNTIVDINRRLEISANDRVFSVSAPTFDLSVYDIFGILEKGGTVVLPSPERSRDPVHWIDRMNDCGVTIWNSAPALMQMLATVVDSSPGRLLKTLRWAMLSGDWIPVDLPGRVRKFAPNCRLLSLGGATEVSIWSIAYPIEQVDPAWTSIPYGMPLANQTIHVLDENFEPCPEWTAGELYIGGDGLALGYWADKAKTAERFVRSPVTGERLYRTGDYGRFRPEGFIEFLGRKDTQIKIRGHRIEIGEIEAALLRLPQVREAAALAMAALSGDRSAGILVGCVVFPKPGSTPGEDELRAQLAESLPSHMIPSRIVALEKLPLSSNGKVDRRALLECVQPILGSLDYGLEDEPHDVLEKAIWNIWRDMLPGRRIGRRDRFYDVGGDSLSVLHMMLRVEKTVGRTVGLSSLRGGGRIVDIAAAARETGPAAAPSLMHCAQTGASKPPFFFAHGDLGNGGLYCQRLACELGPDQTFYAIAPHGTFGGNLPSTFKEVAADYVKMIRSVQPKGPYYMGGYCNGAMAMYEGARQLIRDGEKVAALIMLDPPDLYFFLMRGKITGLARRAGLTGHRAQVVLHRIAELIVSWQYHASARFLLRKLRERLIDWIQGIKRFVKSEECPMTSSMLKLNFHYNEVIAGYELQPYPAAQPVWIILRQEDTKLCNQQIERWGKLVPDVRFEGISGTHVELKHSIEEIADIVKTAMGSSPETAMACHSKPAQNGRHPKPSTAILLKARPRDRCQADRERR
ncbi:MAG: amino acid adenylation domain-containing protein [Methylacidiphilales bacterium]|nr:amino acid adenylation domain-containing protein [Candidatus Methylacidiphilales bacterium]